LSRGPTPALPGDRPAHARRAAEAGQGLIEYGLILVIMAVVCVVSLLFFGDQLSSLLSLIASAV
jgi:Flp pilus assembly pilin Flp